MKKLFALFALCTLALSACENGGNTDTANGANLKLRLISPDSGVLELPAEGGQAEITFELVEDKTRSAAPLKVTATTTAEWISDINVTESSVTFTYAENSDVARSTNFKLSYGNQKEIIVVDQAKANVPDVKFTATHLNGTYWGKFPNKRGFNYQIILGTQRCAHYLVKPYGSYEYRFNIYSDVSSAFNDSHSVPVGTYLLDSNSTGNIGTIDGHADQSYMFGPNGEDMPYRSAKMVITENSIVVDVEFYDNTWHHIEYHGSLEYEDYINPTYEDVFPVSQYTEDINFNVTDGSINVNFRGDYYGTGCDVWWFSMVESTNPYNGVYLILDLIVPKSRGGYSNDDGFLGEFKFFNEKPESYEYTIPTGRLRADCMQMHAWYLICVKSEVDMNYAAPMTSGSVKVTKNEDYTYTFEIDSTDDNGNKIVGTFTGKPISWFDQSCD